MAIDNSFSEIEIIGGGESWRLNNTYWDINFIGISESPKTMMIADLNIANFISYI